LISEVWTNKATDLVTNFNEVEADFREVLLARTVEGVVLKGSYGQLRFERPRMMTYQLRRLSDGLGFVVDSQIDTPGAVFAIEIFSQLIIRSPRLLHLFTHNAVPSGKFWLNA
jgi:hypothetical protein